MTPVSNDLGLIAIVNRETVRFALTDLNGGPQPYDLVTWPVRQFTTFTAAAEAYLRGVQSSGWPSRVAIAIAGVPVGEVVSVTGGQWYLSRAGLAGFLRSQPLILNDFAASVFAIPQLDTASLKHVTAHRSEFANGLGTIALIGPMEGLGTAGLVRMENGERGAVIQSEAGNAGLTTRTHDEFLFAREMGRVSGHFVPEHLLSEQGLVRAADFLAGRSGGAGESRAQHIIRQARAGERNAQRALDLFVGALGEYARAVVMTLGAWDGLYFCGPLIEMLEAELSSSWFRERFEGADKYKRRLSEVPIVLVQSEGLDVLGASVALHDN